MYKIYADNVLIYDDTSQDPYVKVASPKLSLEKNTAGTLKMTIPPGNAGYDYIARMVTEIKVEKDGREYWSGRVLQEDKDFWNNRSLTCEGELAYLNDTTQPLGAHLYTGAAPIRMYLDDLFTEHNKHVPSNRQFQVGVVTVTTDKIDTITNHDKTIDCISKLIDEYGGFVQIRKEGGVRYLDYWKEEPGTSSQTIEFGKNLIDFTTSFDATEFATVVVPLGAKLEESEFEDVESYLTVEDATVSGADGSRFVKSSQETIDAYGWIEVVVHFDDINDPNELYRRGKRYLEDSQFEKMVIELSAFDLHYLNPDIEDVKLGDLIWVISPPHGLRREFPVGKLDIPLDQPQNTTFQLGAELKTSLTSASNKANAEILAKLSQAPDINEDAILQAAQANANALMNMTLNGYVTLLTEEDESGRHSEGLYISQSMPLKDPDTGEFVAQRFWKWSSTGLGYTDDGGETWKVAMTMDGSIVGDRIAAGTIHGSKITAGSLGLTSSAGEEKCTISLSVLGRPGDDLEIGEINGNDGTNIESTGAARSVIKYRITSGTKVSAGDYYFSLYRYSDNDTVESGFVTSTGFSNVEYTVTTTAWYRIVLMKATSGTEVVAADLAPMAAAIRIGDESTVITSADIRINGMVTFAALSEPNRTTVINGDYIKTGSVKANYIDLKGLTVRSTKKNGQTVPEYTSFAVDQNGEVTVNGNVTLGPGTTISWAQVMDSSGTMSAEDIYNTANDAKSDAGDALDAANEASSNASDALDGLYALAHGDYTDAGTTFISEKNIYSPTIYGGIVAAGMFTGLDAGTKAASLSEGIRVANSIEIVKTSDNNWVTQGWIGCITGNDGTSNTTGVGLSSYDVNSSGYGGKIMLTNAGSLFDYSESKIFGAAAGASILAHVATSGGYDYGEIKLQTYEWDSGNNTYGSSQLTFSRGRLKFDVLVLGPSSYGTEANRLSLSPVEGQLYFQTD